MKVLIPGLLLVTLGGPGGALAQPEREGPDPSTVPPESTTVPPNTPATPPENVGKPIGDTRAGFEQLDASGDGRISKTEAKASTELTAEFARFDTNGDGALSRPEYEAFGRDPR